MLLPPKAVCLRREPLVTRANRRPVGNYCDLFWLPELPPLVEPLLEPPPVLWPRPVSEPPPLDLGPPPDVPPLDFVPPDFVSVPPFVPVVVLLVFEPRTSVSPRVVVREWTEVRLRSRSSTPTR